MIGKTLSNFEITAKLGAGGMGEVYRATDTKLGREVAIKVLPNAVSQDAERLARFEREARVLASLNHPNIASIYSIEKVDVGEGLAPSREGTSPSPTTILVMELAEGETLARRIARGAIPIDEAIAIAMQIADALEAAHTQGIVHRDLKPANINVDGKGQVKVLDFGLAKAFQPAVGDPNLSQSPTISLTAAATQMGMILGTAAYMSPEQAKGKRVDKQTDVWAFGCVLYEMLSGSRPFAGEDVSETLARVIERELDLEPLPAATPPALVRVIERSLRKNPKNRLHDIADVRLEIEEATAPGASETARQDIQRPGLLRRAVPWSIATLMTLIAAAAIYWVVWDRPAPGAMRAHLQIVLPDGLRLAVDTAHPTLAISPDGSRLVFVGDDGQTRRLYLRDLAGKEARAIAGSERAASPFFSPDGAWIGYFAGTGLMKVSSSSGAPVAVHTTTSTAVNRGATWLDGLTVVIAGSPNSGLSLAAVAGQEKRPMTDMTFATDSEAPFSWPDALPDGRGVIFTDNADESLETARIALLSVDTGGITQLGSGGTNPRFSPTGHILYARGGSLYAVLFDVERSKTTGAEFRVLDGVISDGNGSAQYTVGGNGTLAYVAGPRVVSQYELVWIDRQGLVETLLESDQPLRDPRLSPDGSQVALTIVDGSNLDVWLFDLDRRTLTRRLTTHPGEDFGAVWHPEGRQLVLGSEVAEDEGEKGPGIAWIREFGAPPEPLTRTPNFGDWEFPKSWSPDGQWLAYVATQGGPGGDIMLLPMSAPGEPVGFIQTPATEQAPMFSPDGRWIAYVSDDTGRAEVYVSPFPGPGDRLRISSQGGTEPLWARNGRELFYREGNRFMVTPVDGSGERFVAEGPEILSDAWRSELIALGTNPTNTTANYDVSLDGTRFVMVRRKNPITATVIDVVLNWPQTLVEPVEASR